MVDSSSAFCRIGFGNPIHKPKFAAQFICRSALSLMKRPSADFAPRFHIPAPEPVQKASSAISLVLLWSVGALFSLNNAG
jgi:hypothetical protein